MVSHYSIPSLKITSTHSGTDYQLQNYATKTDIWQRENAVWVAQFVLSDQGNSLYNNKIAKDDLVKIYLNYKEVEDPLTSASLRLYGRVQDLRPYMSSTGEILVATLRAANAEALLQMVCPQEYGSDSQNSSLNTLTTVITDSTTGLIPKYANYLLGGATASGYTLDVTLVETTSGTFPFLYCPGKPALSIIEDLLDLEQASRGASAGYHWIVKPEESGGSVTSYFLLAEIGNHPSNPIVAAKWPNWWNTDQAGSTIQVKKDIRLVSVDDLQQEANYILYSGTLWKPGNKDAWSNYANTTALKAAWDYTGNYSGHDIASESTIVRFNDYSIKALTGADAEGGNITLWYPKAQTASWNIEDWGGKYNIPQFVFYIYCSSNLSRNPGNTPIVGFCTTNSNNRYHYTFGNLLPQDTAWYRVSLPIGPQAADLPYGDGGYLTIGSPDWADIDFIWFAFDSTNSSAATAYLDGIHFEGYILRGAHDTSESPKRMKVIYDNMGKDDSGVASDDSGMIGKLAYAELLRSTSGPLIGTVQIPAQPSILPGQKAHLHACHVSGSTYRINSDVRIVEHHHSLTAEGYLSNLTWTNDLTNSRPIGPVTAYNRLLNAISPKHQSRQSSSMSSFNIDITQTILEKSY